MSALPFLAAFAGLAAGVAHVLSGPDHLVAVLPFALKSRTKAVRMGALWGLGHGLGVMVLAVIVLLVRAAVNLESLSRASEIVVAVCLLGLGAWSIRQSRVVVVHQHAHTHRLGTAVHSHPHLHVGKKAVEAPHEHGRHPHALLGLGMVHGVAGGSHLLGVLPSLALGRIEAITYLAGFLAGGLGAMAVFAFAAGKLLFRPAWLPRGLAVAGGASIMVGVFWLVSATSNGSPG